MQALILIGRKETPEGPVVENIYTGLDGVELEKAHAAAVRVGGWTSIGRITNPQVSPMPIVEGRPKVTTPVFPRAKAARQPEAAKAPRHIENMESDLARQRKGRFQVRDFKTEPPKKPADLRQDGPTINEHVASGRSRGSYPPVGFAAKPEEFDQAKVDELAKAAAAKAPKREAKPKIVVEAKKPGPPARQPAAGDEAPATETAGAAPTTETETKIETAKENETENH